MTEPMETVKNETNKKINKILLIIFQISHIKLNTGSKKNASVQKMFSKSSSNIGGNNGRYERGH